MGNFKIYLLSVLKQKHEATRDKMMHLFTEPGITGLASPSYYQASTHTWKNTYGQLNLVQCNAKPASLAKLM